jgi:hypothetical protein
MEMKQKGEKWIRYPEEVRRDYRERVLRGFKARKGKRDGDRRKQDCRD